MKRKIIYKPSIIDIIFDVMILILGIVVIFKWYPFTTRIPFEKYSLPALIYLFLWVSVSYFTGRYYPLHKQKYLKTNLKLFNTTLLVFFILWLLTAVYAHLNYSIVLIFTFTTIIFAVYFLFYLIYFAILYAVDYDEEKLPYKSTRVPNIYKPKPLLDKQAYKALISSVLEYSGLKMYKTLSELVNFEDSGNLILFNSGYFELKSKPDYQYLSLVNLEILNNIRGINKLFSIANNKLTDNGIFICLFESKSTRKKKIMKRFPRIIRFIVYFIDYIFKRVIPKIFITRRLYYDITKGKKRILSKTEVLGRLYYCGFEVIEEKKCNGLNIIVARRRKEPEELVKRTYGPLIRLKRIGKNGVKFNVYKMRTMHPYSEYLQSYIFSKNKLKEGGKFNRDIRVTTLGKIMRKYWLDELPMLMNLLNGDMKLVGVRPLSMQYYSLYSRELQEKRIKFKPGLLPPFYADMPRTLDEIQNSEMNYLTQCEKRGVFLTDIKYLFLILRNILFKKARSA